MSFIFRQMPQTNGIIIHFFRAFFYCKFKMPAYGAYYSSGVLWTVSCITKKIAGKPTTLSDMEDTGLEPATLCTSSKCSPS